jgi:dTDP-4-dehydrorhamnose reductase
VLGASAVARACADLDLPLASFSSDLVFDGAKRAPYIEGDRVAPLGVYGASKAESEGAVLDAAPQALVVRTSWFFGPWDEANFLTTTLRTIACGIPVHLPGDLVVSPTYVPHLVDATLDLLLDGERGIWHLASAGPGTTVADVARRAARRAGLDAGLVRGCPAAELGYVAARPAHSALATERGAVMPSLERGLAAYLHSRAWERRLGSERSHDGHAEVALAS